MTVLVSVFFLTLTLGANVLAYGYGYRVGRERGRLDATREHLAWVEAFLRRGSFRRPLADPPEGDPS